MKICKTCKDKKDCSEFGVFKYSKDGLQPLCTLCKRLREKEYYKKTQERQRERKRNANKTTLTEQQFLINKEKRKIYDRAKYIKNKDTILKKHKEYYQSNKYIFNARANKYRANKLQATPAWADLEKIKLVYEKAKWLESITGLKYHVDHVIPLQNKDVCGLHVWENLQILEASINLQKNNNLI